MDGILFLVMLLIVISFHMKAYYTYKFLIIEEFNESPEGLFKFSFNAKHVKHKIHSFGFFPVLSKATLDRSKKAKGTANLFITVFYISIAFVVGYSFLVGKYVAP